MPRGSGRASSWAEVGERLRAFAGEGPFARAAHFSLRSDPRGSGGLLQVTTLDTGDGDLLSDGRVIGLDDPVRDFFDHSGAFEWRDGVGEGGRLTDLVAGLGVARAQVRRGWALPIRGPARARGLFTVTSAGDDPLEGRRHRRLLEPWLSVFGWEFHGSVVSLLERAEEAWTRLSPREVEVLSAAARGLTARETADRLALSAETVEGYLRDAVRRLGCLNKTHAVAVAVRCGVI